MHNLMLNFFGFLRSCLKFLKVILLFLVVFLVMYWMQDLTQKTWEWYTPVAPFFKNLLNYGKDVSSESIMLFAAVFEFKYLVVMGFFGIIYLFVHLCFIGVNSLEEVYHSGRKMYKNYQEKSLNLQFAVEQTFEQKKIKNYQIFVQTFVKSGFAHREYNINLEEQNKILIKHLFNKTGFSPNKYQDGFLFSFNSFDRIDEILDVFSKLNQSKAPLDFLICLQIIDSDNNASEEELNTLIGLKILNKITTLANTAYRYRYNENQRYKTVQVGLFQKGGNTFEVHEFITKD